MLEGVNSEDKEMVTTVKGVIKAVLDGVKVWPVPGGPGQGPRTASLLVFITEALVPKPRVLRNVSRRPWCRCALSGSM